MNPARLLLWPLPATISSWLEQPQPALASHVPLNRGSVPWKAFESQAEVCSQWGNQSYLSNRNGTATLREAVWSMSWKLLILEKHKQTSTNSCLPPLPAFSPSLLSTVEENTFKGKTLGAGTLIRIPAKAETGAEVQNTAQNSQITTAACSLQTWIIPQQETKPTQPSFPSLSPKPLNLNPKTFRFHKAKLFMPLKSVLLSATSKF